MINHKFTTNLFITYTTLFERVPILPGLYNAIHRMNWLSSGQVLTKQTTLFTA